MTPTITGAAPVEPDGAHALAPQKGSGRSKRASHLEMVRLREMVASPKAQRQFKPGWAAEMAAAFDLEKLGFPVVSKRGDVYYIIDGQHRIAALRLFGFLPDDTVQCEVYVDLTEREEAELFLGRNRQKTVDAMSRFRVAVAAERPAERVIDETVRHLGLHVGRRDRRTRDPHAAVSCVGVLLAVHDRVGDEGLAKTLRIVRDAYGPAGLDGPVIDGVGYCVQRYDGTIEEGALVAAMRAAAGGFGGMMTQAEKYHSSLGQPRAQCIAAAVVDIHNRAAGKRNRLAPWWKE